MPRSIIQTSEGAGPAILRLHGIEHLEAVIGAPVALGEKGGVFVGHFKEAARELTALFALQLRQFFDDLGETHESGTYLRRLPLANENGDGRGTERRKGMEPARP